LANSVKVYVAVGHELDHFGDVSRLSTEETTTNTTKAKTQERNGQKYKSKLKSEGNLT